MTVRVIVLHNVDRDHFTGYEVDHNLIPVFTTLWSGDYSDDSIKTQAWHIFNVGDDPEFPASAADPDRGMAESYRKRDLDGVGRNRSLSTGDVLIITDESSVPVRLYSVERLGWQRRAVADAIVKTIAPDHAYGTVFDDAAFVHFTQLPGIRDSFI